MPHRNAHERAEYLRRLAEMLPEHVDNLGGALATRQTVDTMNEIADYIVSQAAALRNREIAFGEQASLPPDTLWVTIHGPALWYFNNEDDTITQARLDTSNDRDVFDERERALCAALIRLAQLHLDEDV